MTLKLTDGNKREIGLYAEIAGVSPESYVRDSARLGVHLGCWVLAAAPDQLKICFKFATPHYQGLALDFHDAAPEPITGDLAVLDRQLDGGNVLHDFPLPANDPLLREAEIVAEAMRVEYAEFWSSAFLFTRYAAQTLRANNEVIIANEHGALGPLEFEMSQA